MANVGVSVGVQLTADAERVLQRIDSTLSKKQTITIDVKMNDATGFFNGNGGITSATKALNQYAATVAKINRSSAGKAASILSPKLTDPIDVTKYQRALTSIRSLSNRVSKLASVGLKDAAENANLNKLSSNVNGLLGQLESGKLTITEFTASLAKLRAEMTRLSGLEKNGKPASILGLGSVELKDATRKLLELKTQANALFSSSKASGLNKDATNGFINSIDDFIKELDLGETKSEDFQARLASLRLEFAQFKAEMGAGGGSPAGLLKGFGSALKENLGGFLTYITGAQAISAAIRGMRQLYESAVDIDGAMTQLKIVTGATDGEMTTFLKSSTTLAKNLGQNISDVLKSVETYSRLGLTT